MTATYWQIALDVPLPGPFDYLPPIEFNPAIDPVGRRVLVPWGRSQRIGLVMAVVDHSAVAPERLRAVERLLLDLAALPSSWRALVQFASTYYQVGLGELALPAIPALLRTASAYRALKPRGGGPVERARSAWSLACADQESAAAPAGAMPELTADQTLALQALELGAGFRVHLLYGVTGSGKTEVYLRAIDQVLRRDGAAQVLLLVPEIALTPQFVRVLRARFPAWRPAVLHSALPEAERAAAWAAAHEDPAGGARAAGALRLDRRR